MAVQRVQMPRLNDGRPCPNPYRYLCDCGHLHPSHRAAVACNAKHRPKQKA